MDFIFLTMLIFFCVSWVAIAVAVYFIPVIIAYIRGHNNLLAVSILTLFLGWTFFGWLAALLWSLNCDIKEEQKKLPSSD